MTNHDDQVLLADRLGQVDASLARNSAELHEERLWRRRYARLFMVVMVFIVVALGLLWNVAQDNSRNGRILVECTTPSRPGDRHECYERGQAQTAKAVQTIIDALRPTTATTQP